MNPELLDVLKAKYGVTGLRLLGNGGFGVVYSGNVFEVSRAIKVSRDVLDEKLLAMANQELEFMQQRAIKACPAIVQLIAVWRELGHLITVWDLGEQSLASRLADCRRQGLSGIPSEELGRHLCDAASALDVINGLGIRHRDIKPDNIILINGRAKITDLGLAVFVGASSLSKTASGTMGYIAPEAYGDDGRGRLTATGDIYALAATAIKLATGHDPFGTNPREIIKNQDAGQPDTTGLNEHQIAAVMSALHPDPQQRHFTTAAEFVAEFVGSNVRPSPIEEPNPRDSFRPLVPTGAGSPNRMEMWSRFLRLFKMPVATRAGTPERKYASTRNEIAAPNSHLLLWASFMAFLATGMGAAIHGGKFGVDTLYNIHQGAIGGAGLSGFCFGIIIGGVLCDKIGYGKLVSAVFLLHVVSAFVTFNMYDMGASHFIWMYWGMFLFGLATGSLEAVANPLVATLFPQQRTHYLSIIHVGWPAGLFLVGVLDWILDDEVMQSKGFHLAVYLIPTVIYGLMFVGQGFPKSEASQKRLKLGAMFKDDGIHGGMAVCFLLLSMFFGAGLTTQYFNKTQPTTNIFNIFAIGGILLVEIGVLAKLTRGAVLLTVLFITHALVGAYLLGTEFEIPRIGQEFGVFHDTKLVFVFTAGLMFVLRFCAEFIKKKVCLSPVGVLLISGICACIGLKLTSGVNTFAGALIALTVFTTGKKLIWPTATFGNHG